MNAMVYNLASRARLAASDKALDIGNAWNLLEECADTLEAMSRTAVDRNRVIRKLRRRCDRRLKLANTQRQPDPAFGDRLRADVVQDFEAKITPHILRNWDRSRIVVFAKHLLGDECQECQKHNKPLDTPPRP